MEPAQETCAHSFFVTVPPIACSFSWKNHPDALKLKELSDAWVVERCKNLPAACKGPKSASFFSPTSLVGSKGYLIATLCYPTAVSAQLLLPIVKMMGWILMLDTIMDDPSEMGADCAHAEHLIESVVAVFEVSSHVGEQDATCRKAAEFTVPVEPAMSAHHLLVECAREWWEEMQLNMCSPSQKARFRKLFTAALKAYCAEVPFRAGLEMPDLETYFRIRMETVFWYPMLVLVELCVGLELHEEALTHPLLIKLQRNVCMQILLLNDIASFGKEYKEGDLFNIVFLGCFSELGLRKLPGENWQALLSRELLQESVRKVSGMIKDIDGETVRIMEEIRGSPMLMREMGMEAYLEGLGHNIAGNLYWHFRTNRYGLCVSTTPDGHPDLHVPFQVHL